MYVAHNYVLDKWKDDIGEKKAKPSDTRFNHFDDKVVGGIRKYLGEAEKSPYFEGLSNNDVLKCMCVLFKKFLPVNYYYYDFFFWTLIIKN